MSRAFTIIELIVSIVVIGIAFMTLPLIIEQSSKSSEVANLAQSYFKAQVLLKEIASKPWDKQNAIKYAEGNGSLFLDVTNGSSNLGRWPDNNGSKRIGSFNSDEEMRHFYSSATFASQIPNNSNDYNSIESYNNYQTQAGNSNFIVNVSYVSDTATQNGSSETAIWNLNGGQSSLTQSTNLKRIVVTVQNNFGANNSVATLSYFSSNIGGQTVPIK